MPEDEQVVDEQEVEAVTPEEQVATKADTDALLDAVKELTKIVGEISQQWEKWRKAGKF